MNGKREEGRSKRTCLWWGFWGTIILLAVATLALAVVASLGIEPGDGGLAQLPCGMSAEERRAEAVEVLGGAKRFAYEQARRHVDGELDRIFDAVHARIPPYADFHYSLRGEYAELGILIVSAWNGGEGWQDHLRERLFPGFDGELGRLGQSLDDRFASTLQGRIGSGLNGLEAGRVGPGNTPPLTSLACRLLANFANQEAEMDAFRVALTDVRQRMAVTVPLAGTASLVTAGALFTGAARVAARKMGAKLTLWGGSKLLQGGSGFALGALSCAWAGPVAVACAVGAGAAAWFGTDKLIIEVDEYFNREGFEADLREFVDTYRTQVEAGFEEALMAKVQAAQNQINDFTLRELAAANSS